MEAIREGFWRGHKWVDPHKDMSILCARTVSPGHSECHGWVAPLMSHVERWCWCECHNDNRPTFGEAYALVKAEVDAKMAVL